MKKKIVKIPEFKSYKEEANFWDSRSLADYWGKFKDVDLSVELNKPRDETLVLRIQKNYKAKLQKIAESKGLNLSALVRIWLTEKLHTV